MIGDVSPGLGKRQTAPRRESWSMRHRTGVTLAGLAAAAIGWLALRGTVRPLAMVVATLAFCGWPNAL